MANAKDKMLNLRTLVDSRMVMQKQRIAFGNRLGAIERGEDEAGIEVIRLLEQWQKRWSDMEEDANHAIEEMLDEMDSPIIEHMQQIKGVGPIIAARIIHSIDFGKAPFVSSLWKYAGFGVIASGYKLTCGHLIDLDVAEDQGVDVSDKADPEELWCDTCEARRKVMYLTGKADRPVKGQKLEYNKRLKTNCYVLATSFLKTGSPYRQIYDEAREYYEVKRPQWTKNHQHRAALRKMIKLFLSHLWLRGRQLENLEVNEPYIFAGDNGHAHYHAPEDFGWKPL